MEPNVLFAQCFVVFYHKERIALTEGLPNLHCQAKYPLNDPCGESRWLIQGEQAHPVFLLVSEFHAPTCLR